MFLDVGIFFPGFGTSRRQGLWNPVLGPLTWQGSGSHFFLDTRAFYSFLLTYFHTFVTLLVLLRITGGQFSLSTLEAPQDGVKDSYAMVWPLELGLRFPTL